MKKFSVAGGVLKRPITVIMITLIIIGFGVFSLSKLKVTLYPSFNIPVLAISTSYKNVAPKDMERIIVEPIEGAVSSIEGIKTLESHIHKGSAFIILRLDGGVNIRETELKVREAISRIRNQLPNEAAEPVIFQFDPNNFPIMHLSLDASNRGLDKLHELATNFVEPRLERLDGVASADVSGGLERTVYVNIKPSSLAQYNLVPSNIEAAIRNNNVEMPIGSIESGPQKYSIHVQSMYQNIDQIKQTIIKVNSQGVPIRVKDVADVEDGFADITNLVEINGKNSVSIDIHKKSDSNTLDVANAVIAAIPSINSKLPGGMKLTVRSNDGKNIQDSISNLTQSSFAALIVVVIVLLIFMGGWRVAAVVAATIPVSVTASFAAMYAAGLTLNILTITALALAIGLLVDNAIVVSESIARKLEEGVPKFQAALEGTNEVIGALLGSTLTTLGIFLPIVIMSGQLSRFFSDFALTISMAISISFIASIILVPVLSLLFFNTSDFTVKNWSYRAIQKLQVKYVSTLRWIMFRKWTVVLFLIALVGGGYVLFEHLPTQFIAQSDSGEVDINIQLPSGTKLVKTAQIIKSFSNEIQNMKPVKTVITQIGQRHFSTQSNEGQISVELVDQSQRKVSTAQFSLRLRHMLKAPGVDVTITTGGNHHGGFGGSGNGIRLSIIGPDVDVLQGISDKIKKTLDNDPKVISIDNGRSNPTPELRYMVNRQRISRLGSSLNQAANSLKTQVQGTRAGYYRDQGEQIPIMIRVPDNLIKTREDLFNLPLLQSGKQRIPVSGLGHFESAKGLSQIDRRDRETVLDINIEVAGNQAQYRSKIIQQLKNRVVLPDGYRYEFTGATRQARQSSNQVFWALIAALALTYMIMASLFENFRDPFVIFFTIPLAIFGAFAGLYIFNTALGITAYVGIFILVGIIVNNGIVLVDYIHLYTEQNEKNNDISYLDHMLEACSRRLRPILLTALTTICSMIPLSLGIGTGADIWAPLARAVIGGLFFGSILTLFVVPTMVISISKERREVIDALREDEKKSG